MGKPLTDEQIWGEPIEPSDDELLEELLIEEERLVCEQCGRPLSFCECY